MRGTTEMRPTRKDASKEQELQDIDIDSPPMPG